MFANKENIESQRTVSTFAIRTSLSESQKLQKSLPLPTLKEIMSGGWGNINI